MRQLQVVPLVDHGGITDRSSAGVAARRPALGDKTACSGDVVFPSGRFLIVAAPLGRRMTGGTSTGGVGDSAGRD
jgi:hypothetical protein